MQQKTCQLYPKFVVTFSTTDIVETKLGRYIDYGKCELFYIYPTHSQLTREKFMNGVSPTADRESRRYFYSSLHPSYSSEKRNVLLSDPIYVTTPTISSGIPPCLSSEALLLDMGNPN